MEVPSELMQANLIGRKASYIPVNHYDLSRTRRQKGRCDKLIAFGKKLRAHGLMIIQKLHVGCNIIVSNCGLGIAHLGPNILLIADEASVYSD